MVPVIAAVAVFRVDTHTVLARWGWCSAQRAVPCIRRLRDGGGAGYRCVAVFSANPYAVLARSSGALCDGLYPYAVLARSSGALRDGLYPAYGACAAGTARPHGARL